jgi:hypothetical protein
MTSKWELWEVEYKNDKWQEKPLHSRQYLNDVMSYAEDQLGIESKDWFHFAPYKYRFGFCCGHKYYTIELAE